MEILNCTCESAQVRKGEEPHLPSARALGGILTQCDMVDVWREKHMAAKQYTWVKVSGDLVLPGLIVFTYQGICAIG